jgi:hypothetical protein
VRYSNELESISKTIRKNPEEMNMKKVLAACLTMAFVLTVALYAFAAEPNRDAIKKKVDDTVAALDGGKTAADFSAAAKEDPYIFRMKGDGTMEVHPALAGQNIRGSMEPVYKELVKADATGLWVKYQNWDGKEKNTYVRKTKDGLIVGCGY